MLAAIRLSSRHGVQSRCVLARRAHVCERETSPSSAICLCSAYFSDAKSHEFSREPSQAWVQREILGNMKTALGDDFDLVAPTLWKTIAEHIIPVQ